MCQRAGQCHHPPPRRDPDRFQRVNLLDYSFLARSGQESPHNGTCCCVAHHTPHDQLSNIKKAPQLRKLIAAQQLPTTTQKCKNAAGLTCSTSLPDAWMELAWVLPSFLSIFPILRSPLAHGPPFRAARGNTQHAAPLACEVKKLPVASVCWIAHIIDIHIKT